MGLFVLAGIGAIAYLSLQVGGLSYATGPSMQLTAVFDDIGGLKDIAPVSVSGVRIGQVRSIGLAEDLRALVTLEVGSDVPLSVDTEASIRTSGLLGDQFIALEPGAEDENLGDGEVLAVDAEAPAGAEPPVPQAIAKGAGAISSFGLDAQGEVYVTSYDGAVWRIVAR